MNKKAVKGMVGIGIILLIGILLFVSASPTTYPTLPNMPVGQMSPNTINGLNVTWKHLNTSTATKQEFILDVAQLPGHTSTRTINPLLYLSDTNFNVSSLNASNLNITAYVYSSAYQYFYNCTLLSDGTNATVPYANVGLCNAYYPRIVWQKLVYKPAMIGSGPLPVSDSMFKQPIQMQHENGKLTKVANITLNQMIVPAYSNNLGSHKYFKITIKIPTQNRQILNYTGTFSININGTNYWDKTHSSWWTSLSPADNTFTSDTTPSFTFTAVSNVSTSLSCELLINNTGYGLNSSTLNNTATTITANSTLTDGLYNWDINCSDAEGSYASSLYNLTVDTIIPSASIDSITTTTNSRNITFNSTASDLNLNSCFYSIYDSNGNIINPTYYWTGNIINTTFTCNSNPQNAQVGLGDYGTFTLDLYAKDRAGNFNLTKKNFTILTTYTFKYQESANVSNQTGVDGSGLNYSGSYISVFTGSAVGWTNESNLIDGNWSSSAYLTDSYYGSQSTLYINYTKPIGALNNSLWRTKIDLADSFQNPLGHNPTNYSIPATCWNQSQTKLQFYLQSWEDSGGIGIEMTCYNGTSYILMYNNYGLNIYEEAMYWSVGAIPSFVSPTPNDNSYLNHNYLPINISVTGSLDTLTTYLYNSTNLIQTIYNTTAPAFNNFTNLNDGIYYVNGSANLSSGGSNNLATRTFTIDTIPPQIQFVPTTNINNTYLNINSILANVSITEINFKNVTFNLYNTTLVNSTTFTDSTRKINWTNLQDGIYYYNVSSYDSANNKNSTETRKITLDTTKPIITNLNITTTDGSKIISFSYNSTDTNLNKCFYSILNTNGTYETTNKTIPCNSPNTSTLSTYGIVYTLYAYANDSLGNVGSSTKTFTLTAPVVTSGGGGGGGSSTPVTYPTVGIIQPKNITTPYSELDKTLIFSEINNFCRKKIGKKPLSVVIYTSICTLNQEELLTINKNINNLGFSVPITQMPFWYNQYINNKIYQTFSTKQELNKYNLETAIIIHIFRVNPPNLNSIFILPKSHILTYTFKGNKPIESCDVLSKSSIKVNGTNINPLSCILSSNTTVEIRYIVNNPSFRQLYTGEISITSKDKETRYINLYMSTYDFNYSLFDGFPIWGIILILFSLLVLVFILLKKEKLNINKFLQ